MDDDRLARIEAAVEGLLRTTRQLDARLTRLEARPAPARGHSPPEEPAPVPPYLAGIGLSGALGLAGRTFLVLGGAFLLRALTDAGLLLPARGVVLGLAYTVFWLVLSDRAGAKRQGASAGFHAFAAILTGYPLLWEAGTRFAVLQGASLALAAGLLTALVLAIAWRHRAAALAWCATFAASTLAVALSFRTGSHVSAPWLLVALGLATLWMNYTRGCNGPRWIAAAAVDLVVLRVVILASRAPELRATPGPAAADAQWLCAGTLFVYTASFVARTLAQRRNVGPFEIAQAVAVLAIGLGGFVHVARTNGGALSGLGAIVLAGGAICYAMSFAFVRRQLGRGPNFFFWSWIALLLVLVGLALVADGAAQVAAGALLAVIAALLGGRHDRSTLRAHAAAYAIAAAVSAGLVAAIRDAFLGTGALARGAPSATQLAALASAVVATLILLATRQGRDGSWLSVAARLALTILAAGGLAAILIAAGVRRFGDDPGAVAVLRTGMLALAAIAFAAGRKRLGAPELGWLAIAAVSLGAVKLVLEDLRAGGALSLFPAFALYGLALILVPRWLRRG